MIVSPALLERTLFCVILNLPKLTLVHVRENATAERPRFYDRRLPENSFGQRHRKAASLRWTTSAACPIALGKINLHAVAYLFDHAWEQERERLAGIEGLQDPFTTDILKRLGVQPGWHCLEIGGGGGSIAAWLCDRVGPSGKVVATDLETKFLSRIATTNLEVRSHDLRKDEFEPGAYDLVHSRKVLEHLPEPFALLEKISKSVRPGGWLFVEDVDHASFLKVTARDPVFFERAFKAYVRAMQEAGFQPFIGRELAGWLRQLGFEQVDCEGRIHEWTAHGSQPIAVFYRLMWRRLRDRVLELKLLSEKEADQFLTDVEDPNFRAIGSISFGAWGRKP